MCSLSLFSIRGVLQHSGWGFSVLVSTFLSKRLHCANSFSHREARVFITKQRNQQLAGFTCCHSQPGNSRDIRDALTRLRKNKLGVFLLWLMCLSKDEKAIITPTHRCRSSMSLSNVWIEQKIGGMEDGSTGDLRSYPSWQPDTQILLAYF